MDRRDFIKSTSVAAVAAAAASSAAASSTAAATADVAAPAVASGVRELRLAMPWARNGRGFDDSARRLERSIETISAGRYRLAIDDEASGLAGLSQGRADIYHGSAHDFVALDRTFAYFAGLPGRAGMRPTFLNAWLTVGGGQTLWDDLAAPHGFKLLLAGHAGARSMLWSREPIDDLSALNGKRIAATGLTSDVVFALGAEAVDVAPATLGAALSSGSIDAVEWGGMIAGYAADLQASARHCYRPGLAGRGFGTVLAIRRDVWDGMGQVDQAIFTAASALELNTAMAEQIAMARSLGAAFVERHGMSFAPLPAPIAEAAAGAAERVVAPLADGSLAAQRIHASYMAFRATLATGRRRRDAEPAV